MVSTPTQRKARLGRLLAELRERSGRSLGDAGQLLRVAESTVSRYETGHIRPSFPVLQALLQYYGVRTEQEAEAVALWEDAGERVTRVRLPGAATKEYRAFVRAESEADSVRVLQQIVVPGLLQTAAYAESVMEAAHRFRDPDVRITRYVAARLNRQKCLEEPNALRLHAVLDETVIRRLVGSAAIMAEQLRHLLATGKRDNVTIQVVPLAAGAYGAMSGSSTIFGFERTNDPTTVYLEYPAGGEWIDTGSDVKRFEDMFGDVAAEAACSPEESAELIRRQIRTLENR